MKTFFARTHNKQVSPLLWPLLPLEWGYRATVSARLAGYGAGFFRKNEAATQNPPVISIGNLTTGGTGKTPVTLAIAQGLIRRGMKVVILTRGYRAKTPQAYVRATSPDFGDEAYLLQKQVPQAVVISGKNRANNLKRAIAEYQPDVVLLDDGYQHLKVQRDLNILLIEGDRLFGNNHLLPLGPLREPLSEIRRADLIMITKTLTSETLETVEGWVKRHCEKPVPVLPVVFSSEGLQSITQNKIVPSHALRHCQAVAVSGIANPDRFERDLQAFLTYKIFRHFKFDDHHAYTPDDAKTMLAFLDQCPKDTVLITTDKDWVKLQALIPAERHTGVYTLRVTPMLDFEWLYKEYLQPLFKKPMAVPS